MYRNNFSIKNSKLYKMKFINTRNCEYKVLNNYNYDYTRTEKYDDK